MTRGVSFRQWAEAEIQKIHQAGLFKNERVILSPQGSDVQTSEGAAVNFCANNYLGLGNHPEILEAAREGLETHGYGMASVRFIWGLLDAGRPNTSIFMVKVGPVAGTSAEIRLTFQGRCQAPNHH